MNSERSQRPSAPFAAALRVATCCRSLFRPSVRPVTASASFSSLVMSTQLPWKNIDRLPAAVAAALAT